MAKSMKYFQRWALTVLLVPVLNVYAHDIGLSTLALKLNKENLTAQMTVARNDLEAKILVDDDLDGKVSQDELRRITPRLERFIGDGLQIQWDHQPAVPTHSSIRVLDSTALEFTLEYPRPQAARLTIQSRIPALLAYGHRQDVTLKGEDDRVVYQVVIDASADPLEIDLKDAPSNGGPFPTFRQFTGLGVEHILQGYDHLLFLLVLLLAGGGFSAAVRIISSFTLAHSITLALATLNYIHLPGRFVEPLIALSIVYVGIENLFARDFQHRWRITFVFGLIHGLGFASVLQDLGLNGSASQIMVPLLSFNLGVEMGQISIVLLTLPFLHWLRKRPLFVLRYAPVCSILVSLIGSFWFLKRTVG